MLEILSRRYLKSFFYSSKDFIELQQRFLDLPKKDKIKKSGAATRASRVKRSTTTERRPVSLLCSGWEQVDPGHYGRSRYMPGFYWFI